jgi:DNA polymerase-3 subunit delta'
MADLETLYGEDRKSKSSRSYRAADAELKRHQKAREKRQVLDVVDRSLMDLMSVYRDVLVLQTRAGSPLVNEEQRVSLAEMARTGTAEDTLRHIDAIAEARAQMLEFNVPPQLALEALMVALRAG